MLQKIVTTLAVLTVMAGALVLGGLAIFTDSASVPSNTFSTGTIDISTAPASAVVTFSNMAPGDLTTQSLAVNNIGSLAMRYAMSTVVNSNSDAVNPLSAQLQLTIKTIDVTTPLTPCDNFDGTTTLYGAAALGSGAFGSNVQGAQAGDRPLGAGVSETLCFRVQLPLTTGNAYQGDNTTVTFVFDAEQTANN